MSARFWRVSIAAAAIVALAPCAAARPRIASVVNGASYKPFVSPGSAVAIFGTGFAESSRHALTVPLPVTLDGVSVTVDDIEAPLYFVSPTQINAQIPFEVSSRTVHVVVRTAGGEQASCRVSLLATAPGIITVDGSGAGIPVLLDADFKRVETLQPGQRVILYAVGLGQTNPPSLSGDPGAASEPYQRVVEAPDVIIGGRRATVEFAGMAPGYAGVYQLNVRAPAQFADNSIFLLSDGRRSNVASFPAELPPVIQGSGIVVSEPRNVSDFRRLQLLTVAKVEIQVGANPSLRLEGDNNVLPLITTEVRGDKLSIAATRGYSIKPRSIRVVVTVPALEGVELVGVGSVSVAGVNAESFKVRVNGVGAVEATGMANSVDVFVEGVNTLRLFDLSSRSTAVWMAGVGTVQVNAEESLFARVFGTGNVVYSGFPRDIDAEVAGIGTVRAR